MEQKPELGPKREVMPIEVIILFESFHITRRNCHPECKLEMVLYRQKLSEILDLKAPD